VFLVYAVADDKELIMVVLQELYKMTDFKIKNGGLKIVEGHQFAKTGRKYLGQRK
jgi:hypothetical protein